MTDAEDVADLASATVDDLREIESDIKRLSNIADEAGVDGEQLKRISQARKLSEAIERVQVARAQMRSYERTVRGLVEEA